MQSEAFATISVNITAEQFVAQFHRLVESNFGSNQIPFPFFFITFLQINFKCYTFFASARMTHELLILWRH